MDSQPERPAGQAAESLIIGIVSRYYPEAQAIYLYGSFGTDTEWPDSDADIAVLLPEESFAAAGNLMLNDCARELERVLRRDVDLVNLRQVSTVLQMQIIFGRLIACADRYAVDEFEMLTLSLYGKLNEERAAILEAFAQTGKAYEVWPPNPPSLPASARRSPQSSRAGRFALPASPASPG